MSTPILFLSFPLEIQLIIARTSPIIWSTMLRISKLFACWASTDRGRNFVWNHFADLSHGNNCFLRHEGKLYLHSFFDQPARYFLGKVQWHRLGVLHRRKDKPAEINFNNGSKKWYRGGELHRGGDLPAVIYYGEGKNKCRRGLNSADDQFFKVYSGEIKIWYRHGKKHRGGDLPAEVHSDGKLKWYRDGELHRGGDLPAVMLHCYIREWWIKGKLERNHGRAILHEKFLSSARY